MHNRGSNYNRTRTTEEGLVTKHRIAVIAGDGIGKEVVPEGMRVLDAAGRQVRLRVPVGRAPWSCDYYSSTAA